MERIKSGTFIRVFSHDRSIGKNKERATEELAQEPVAKGL